MATAHDEARTPRRRYQWLSRYGCAVASVAAALVGTHVLGEQRAGVSPLFFGAVAISAWYGGLGPGLLATLLSGLATAFFLFEPAYSLRIEWADLIRVGLFSLVAMLIGLLHESTRRAQERIIEATEQAVAANRAKDRFLAVLSHELRNPLTPIVTVAGVLESDGRLPEDVREDMRMIGRNAQLQLRLVDDLLDLNRIVRGRLALCLEVVDAHALVEEVVGMCHADAAAKGVRLEALPAAERHHLRADGGRLRQVVWNLVRNALKFTPAGGRVAVTTSDDADGALRLEVSDTGIGIDQGALGRIFAAFEQGDDSINRRFGGLGLGLAISKCLVEAHLGTLTASSAGKGYGATFTVRLPAVDAPPSGGAAWRPDSERRPFRADPQNDRTPLRVLLVENDGDTCRAIGRVLRARGHAVTALSTLSEALRVAGGGEFDLLICNLTLPDGSGMSLMRAVRRRTLRAIALSTCGSNDEWRESHDAGFDEYLTKPVSTQTLEAAVLRLTHDLRPSVLRLAGNE